MTRITLRRLFAMTATTGLAAALAACGPDDAQQAQALAPLLSGSVPATGWSLADLAGADPAFLAGGAGPLPDAVPMRAAYRGDYGYAPAYDYGPDPYYDDSYYEDDPGADDYQWLALAAALTGMLGNAPPDYAFGYDGVQPWAWETGDRYLRYAEPIYGGYRYYYYEPGRYTPYLVSDPYYSYAYRDDRLVVIYDRSGRILDARRADLQRRAARDYYARARQMYLAAHREPRVGVAAPLWQRHRDEIARQPRLWQQAKAKRAAWQQWDAKNQKRLHRDWAGEALVRREAERSFSGWQKADFKTPTPKFYTPQQRHVQLQKVAEIRQDRQLAAERHAAQKFVAARQPKQQKLVAAERARQHTALVQRQLAEAQEATSQRGQAHARQQQAQRAEVQREAQAQKARQQAAAATRQRAAHENRLQAQRTQQARLEQQHKQAQQARAVQQQKQAQQARAAAERQKAQQARAAQQQQAQQARAARHQKQAQQARAAQQLRAQQAHAERQKQQAAAAPKQRSAGNAQAAQESNRDHGRGHGRDRG